MGLRMDLDFNQNLVNISIKDFLLREKNMEKGNLKILMEKGI